MYIGFLVFSMMKPSLCDLGVYRTSYKKTIDLLSEMMNWDSNKNDSDNISSTDLQAWGLS